MDNGEARSAHLSVVLSIAMVTVLGAWTPAASGAEAVRPDLEAGSAVETGEPAGREALLAGLDQRERELRGMRRERVAGEVRARAAELGVPEAKAGRLLDLLYERALLEIAGERCRLLDSPGRECPLVAAARADLEAEFLDLAGVTAAEFKSGRRTADGKPPGLAPRLLGGPSFRTDPDFCRCSASVYSLDRWMNRFWALECNNHGGHGVCSTNLDSAHTPGAGAMTGDIDVFFGSSIRGKSCPDDHRTCFKGPVPSKPGGGEWGNVCNCDTIHSQFSNPFASWYGGDLTEPNLVFQGSFHDMVGDGPCAGAWIQVNEYIEENDPWCCDDPMGTLVAATPIGEGTQSADVPTSAQNCNGGSQSGVYPYCGTFGATIRILTTCQTQADDPFGSCWGRCGEVLPDASCHCDWDCTAYGDCCWDYCDACTLPEFPAPECSVS